MRVAGDYCFRFFNPFHVILCIIHFILKRIFSPYFLHICESHHQKYHIVSRNFLSSPERPLVPVCTVLCSVIAFWHLSINRQRQDTRLESCNIWELGRDCLECYVSLFNNRHILHIIFPKHRLHISFLQNIKTIYSQPWKLLTKLDYN